MIKKYDVIIFDCDGVILDSNKLKTKAFAEILKDYPKEQVRKFIKYHTENGGISRYKKLEHFFLEILKKPLIKEEYDNLLIEFSEQCEVLYQKSNYTEGALDLLDYLKLNNISCYVASGSEELALNLEFNRRQIKPYFEIIYGSPKTKNKCVNLILQENKNKKFVLIGDNYADLKAAKDNNIEFIYMQKYTEQNRNLHNICVKEAVTVIDDLRQLIKEGD